ncbi:hypothetical protein [Moorena bouillonii]|uniref:Uncharacterized protein n=1 Tax=Moorena bouillonii PNG TaxID=568701 RepID=A0A1U7MWI1_9CYAN|nr:hypothetical protein [Moorena bouillonii]OLT58056.1 hypothetical protein BJP37_02370 [Moorena bouillonii PNG]
MFSANYTWAFGLDDLIPKIKVPKLPGGINEEIEDVINDTIDDAVDEIIPYGIPRSIEELVDRLFGALAKDYGVIQQTPYSAGYNEVLIVSPSTGAEQRMQVNLPEEEFRIYEIAFKGVSVPKPKAVVGGQSPLQESEIKERLSEFKIEYDDQNKVQAIILADGTKAEFSNSQAIIYGASGKPIETITLSQANANPSENYIALKNTGKQKCESNVKQRLQATLDNANLKNLNLAQLGTSDEARLLAWAGTFGREGLADSLLPDSRNQTIQAISCQAPVQCNKPHTYDGKSEVRTDLFKIPPGTNPKVALEYQFFTIPDRLEIFHEGSRVFEDGPTSGHHEKDISDDIPDNAKYVGVKVIGNRDEGTRWWYTIHCQNNNIGDILKVENDTNKEIKLGKSNNLLSPEERTRLRALGIYSKDLIPDPGKKFDTCKSGTDYTAIPTRTFKTEDGKAWPLLTFLNKENENFWRWFDPHEKNLQEFLGTATYYTLFYYDTRPYVFTDLPVRIDGLVDDSPGVLDMYYAFMGVEGQLQVKDFITIFIEDESKIPSDYRDSIATRSTQTINDKILELINTGFISTNSIKKLLEETPIVIQTVGKKRELPTFDDLVYNPHMFVAVHGVQGANLTLKNLRIEVSIDPESGIRRGTWRASLVNELCDDFAFGRTEIDDAKTFNMINRLFEEAEDLVSQALERGRDSDEYKTKINSAIDKIDQALKLITYPEDGFEALLNVRKKAEIKKGVLIVGYLLQRYGSAKPYMVKIPLKSEITGEFTIPDRYQSCEGNGCK